MEKQDNLYSQKYVDDSYDDESNKQRNSPDNYKKWFLLTAAAFVAAIIIGPMSGMMLERYLNPVYPIVVESLNKYPQLPNKMSSNDKYNSLNKRELDPSLIDPFNSSAALNSTFQYPSWFGKNLNNYSSKNWGSYSPYWDEGGATRNIPAADPHGVNSLPQTCSYSQVHVLHRHAERFPTASLSVSLAKFGQRLVAWRKNFLASGNNTSDDLYWLNNWNYTLGNDLLTPRGMGTEFKAGADFWAAYGKHLYNASENGAGFYHPSLNVYPNGQQRPLPVLRTTDQERIQTSARAWAAGFFGFYSGDTGSLAPITNEDAVYDLVLQPEAVGNSTLAGYFTCPRNQTSNLGPNDNRPTTWQNTYLPEIRDRLSPIFKGLNLTNSDVLAMQHICTFEVAASGTSRFCELFNVQDWIKYQYLADLNFWTEASFGTPYGVGEGAGWVAELLARLENRTINTPQYGVNVTLDSNPETFPIGQPFYMDMSHDSVIISVLAALGFDFFADDLPADHYENDRDFVTSLLVPYGARLIIEIVSCSGSTSSSDEPEGEFVRIKLNERVLPIGKLANCTERDDGLCAKSEFIASLHTSLESMDYDNLCGY